MKEIFEGVERILWFVYRVFFTLLPTVAFLFGTSLIVLHYNLFSLDGLAKEIIRYREISWIIVLSIIVTINLILSSISSFLVKYRPSFSKKQDFLERDLLANRNYQKLKKELSKTKDDLSNEFIENPHDILNLLRLKIIEELPGFHNYTWFLFSNTKMYGNLYVSILMLCSIALPLQILYLEPNMKILGFAAPVILLFVHFAIELLFDFPKDKEMVLNTVLAFILFIGIAMIITWKHIFPQIISFYFILIPILHYLMKKSYWELLEFYEQIIDAYVSIKFENQLFGEKNKNI